uniref:Uncharacterized protein n=1 Tax=Molossus molossus TaxID=27622 RepID=A0A7J8GL96_MOLMO|nr:hypothetical protein HJG59_011541 [Molossus molossus]
MTADAHEGKTLALGPGRLPDSLSAGTRLGRVSPRRCASHARLRGGRGHRAPAKLTLGSRLRCPRSRHAPRGQPAGQGAPHRPVLLQASWWPEPIPRSWKLARHTCGLGRAAEGPARLVPGLRSGIPAPTRRTRIREAGARLGKVTSAPLRNSPGCWLLRLPQPLSSPQGVRLSPPEQADAAATEPQWRRAQNPGGAALRPPPQLGLSSGRRRPTPREQINDAAGTQSSVRNLSRDICLTRPELESYLSVRGTLPVLSRAESSQTNCPKFN